VTSIEWTRGDDGVAGKTWNPVLGCTRVSAGCDHCYAIGVAHRGLRPEHTGLTRIRPPDSKRPGLDWNGTVKFLPERLAEPLRWRKPRRVFVNSMSDLFHNSMSGQRIAAVFGAMLMASRHTYQVLTKRPELALYWYTWIEENAPALFGDEAAALAKANGDRISPDPRVLMCVAAAESAGVVAPDLASATAAYDTWPPRSVHLGVSVEDQATADERIPLLLQCPAAIRFVSYEPALGPVDFNAIGKWRDEPLSALSEQVGNVERPALDWIIVGGESGPGARVFELAWARKVIADCHAIAGGPRVFIKQLGSCPFDNRTAYALRPSDRKGGDMAEWPPDLRVREWPKEAHHA